MQRNHYAFKNIIHCCTHIYDNDLSFIFVFVYSSVRIFISLFACQAMFSKLYCRNSCRYSLVWLRRASLRRFFDYDVLYGKFCWLYRVVDKTQAQRINIWFWSQARITGLSIHKKRPAEFGNEQIYHAKWHEITLFVITNNTFNLNGWKWEYRGR